MEICRLVKGSNQIHHEENWLVNISSSACCGPEPRIHRLFSNVRFLVEFTFKQKSFYLPGSRCFGLPTGEAGCQIARAILGPMRQSWFEKYQIFFAQKFLGYQCSDPKSIIIDNLELGKHITGANFYYFKLLCSNQGNCVGTWSL